MKFSVYLISMQKDTERREKLKAAFTRHCEKFILIDAVNGGELKAREYFKLMFGGDFYPVMPPSEVGCALSHIKALEEFLNSGAEMALVIEDDLIGNDECFDYLERLLDGMGGEFFLHCGGLSKKRRIFVKNGRSTDEALFEVPQAGLFALTMTCSYLVTRKPAEQIIARQKKELRVADDWRHILSNAEFPVYYSNIFEHSCEVNPSGLQTGRDFSKKLGKEKSRLPILISIHKAFRETRKALRQIRAYCSGYRMLHVAKLPPPTRKSHE